MVTLPVEAQIGYRIEFREIKICYGSYLFCGFTPSMDVSESQNIYDVEICIYRISTLNNIYIYIYFMSLIC